MSLSTVLGFVKLTYGLVQVVVGHPDVAGEVDVAVLDEVVVAGDAARLAAAVPRGRLAAHLAAGSRALRSRSRKLS